MKINSTRFGRLDVESGDLLMFPHGLVGFEDCRQWVLLADAQNDVLGWLQSAHRPEIALAVVSPRRFVANYQVRVPRSELAPLQLEDPTQAKVLATVSKHDHAITLNLKAPLVVNLDKGLGRQVLAAGEQPLQYELHGTESYFKKIA